MPVVPVTDMVVHPRERDLVVATYGRGLYVANVAWLSEARVGVLDAPALFFSIRPQPQRREEPWGNFELYGDRQLIVPNEDGLDLEFHLGHAAVGKVAVTISDATGAVVRTFEREARAGFNRVTWDMSVGRGRLAAPGEYTVALRIGDRTLTRKATIRPRVH
jgi:hypothetical protein